MMFLKNTLGLIAGLAMGSFALKAYESTAIDALVYTILVLVIGAALFGVLHYFDLRNRRAFRSRLAQYRKNLTEMEASSDEYLSELKATFNETPEQQAIATRLETAVAHARTSMNK